MARPKGTKNKVQSLPGETREMRILRKLRARTALRLRRIRLFGEERTKPREKEAPILGALMEMGDVYAKEALTPAERIQLLDKIFTGCRSIMTDASGSYRESVSDMKDSMRYQFMIKQHEDRMDLAREAYEGKRGGAISKLMKIAGDTKVPDLNRSMSKIPQKLEEEARIDNRNDERKRIAEEMDEILTPPLKPFKPAHNPLGPIQFSDEPTDSEE